MARIRTIKPEFTESESIGKLSREARLLFILLWTIVDDDGRARASSRFLASRLYPYDDDAVKKICGWLEELDEGGHVRLYEVDGNTYLDIPKWREHQKIDHPAKSRLPEFRETVAKPSDTFARDRETFAPHIMDHGPSTMDLGPRTVEGGAVAPPAPLEEAAAVYNTAAEEAGWPKVQRLTTPRKAALKNRLAECGGLDGWQTAMAKAAASHFLTGKTTRSNGHANWRPDFDWFTTAGNFTKLMEGSYDNPTRIPQQQSGIGAVLAALAD
jgi:hypothetical protein